MKSLRWLCVAKVVGYTGADMNNPTYYISSRTLQYLDGYEWKDVPATIVDEDGKEITRVGI